MRSIAYTWEKEANREVNNYWQAMAKTWGFDKVFSVNPCGCQGSIPSWEELFKEEVPGASIVVPCTYGGIELNEFVEPEGDVVYIVGGDYTTEFNYRGEADYRITLDTNLSKYVGTFSFLALSVIAHHVYKQRIN